MADLQTYMAGFRTPSEEFRPVTMWFWNDDLRKEEITFQLEQFKQQGVCEIFVNATWGIDVDYLSDEYFAFVQHAVEECKRLVLAFQPHTYTRTKALFEDFVRELRKSDVLVLAEIYAARESNTVGVSSADLAARIPGAVFCETLPEVSSYMRCIAQEGDMMITLGCGDIYRAADALFA